MLLTNKLGCDCCDRHTSRSLMVRNHGTVEEFTEACWRAVPSMITPEEAMQAVDSYKVALEHALAD